jgi:hypothetical protein
VQVNPLHLTACTFFDQIEKSVEKHFIHPTWLVVGVYPCKSDNYFWISSESIDD